MDLRLPVQFHVGYGDSDVDLDRCNPLLLTPLLRAIQPTGVPVMLLHNYPYQREAGYLAQVFPHVYVDAGLATHNVGAGPRRCWPRRSSSRRSASSCTPQTRSGCPSFSTWARRFSGPRFLRSCAPGSRKTFIPNGSRCV